MVHHPLNENLQNIVPRKAVPCDIVKELFKVRDTLLDSADRNTIKVYEVAYEKFFEEYEERGSATANDVWGVVMILLSITLSQRKELML